MKKIALLTVLSFQCAFLFAQLIPVQNSLDDIVSHRVKVASTYYLDGDREELFFQKEFDADGNLLRKYLLLLWDAVSYQYTTTYSYDEKGILKEEQTIQEFLELNERDKEYLRIFGDNPLNERILYYYSDKGKLNNKSLYAFGAEGFDPKTSTNQTITYQYENAMLILEESTSSDDKFFNKNYLIEYSYDSTGNLVQKTMAYGLEKEMQRNYIYKYNDYNQLIEEQVIDISIPHNNKHLKYEYNDEGQLISKLSYNEELEDFEIETSYVYDSMGNLVSGEREVSFEYYKNGLIKSESWTDPISDEQFTFITKYQFH